MDEKQELNERANPVFNTARATLIHLSRAGDKDADLYIQKLGIDPKQLANGNEETTFSPDLILVVETRYRASNEILSSRKEKNIVDLPCGYTPRAVNIMLADKRYIGCDLPVVIEELAPVANEFLAERNIKDRHAGIEPEPPHDDISLRRGVRSSFYGADFRSDEETERRHTVCMSSEVDEVWAERCPQKPTWVRFPHA